MKAQLVQDQLFTSPARGLRPPDPAETDLPRS